MKAIFKTLWEGLKWAFTPYRFYRTPHLCPTCGANLQKQKGAYQGDGLKAENRYYKCHCGTECCYTHIYSGYNHHEGRDEDIWKEFKALRKVPENKETP